LLVWSRTWRKAATIRFYKNLKLSSRLLCLLGSCKTLMNLANSFQEPDEYKMIMIPAIHLVVPSKRPHHVYRVVNLPTCKCIPANSLHRKPTRTADWSGPPSQVSSFTSCIEFPLWGKPNVRPIELLPSAKILFAKFNTQTHCGWIQHPVQGLQRKYSICVWTETHWPSGVSNVRRNWKIWPLEVEGKMKAETQQ
jgi:hypothetical protein